MKIVLTAYALFILILYFALLYRGKFKINGKETDNLLIKAFASLIAAILGASIIWLPIIGFIAVITYL